MGPLGALLGALGALFGTLLVGFLGALGALLDPQEAPGRHSGGKMEPQRLSNEPQEVSGVRESPGKQPGAPRRNGERPASARSARARAPRENSLQHRGVLGEPRTTASTHLTHHRRDRKAACTIAKPPQGPERSLHHRQATAGTGKQLAPPPSHRQASIGQQLHERLQAQLFLTPLSVFSLGRFWAWGGDYRRGGQSLDSSQKRRIKNTWSHFIISR